MKTLILLAIFCLPGLAQLTDHYITSANTTALTVQQPTGRTGRQVTFGDSNVAGASVYCAANQTATISWDGTAATATAGSEKMLPGTTQPSGMTIWTASNVGTGTVGPVYNVIAGTTFLIDLTWFKFGTQGPSQNLTITTNGTCTITFAYSAN